MTVPFVWFVVSVASVVSVVFVFAVLLLQFLLVVTHQLRQTKVSDENVRLGVAVAEEQVFWLEVAVHNALLMKVLDGRRHLPCQATCVCLGEVALVKERDREREREQRGLIREKEKMSVKDKETATEKDREADREIVETWMER